MKKYLGITTLGAIAMAPCVCGAAQTCVYMDPDATSSCTSSLGGASAYGLIETDMSCTFTLNNESKSTKIHVISMISDSTGNNDSSGITTQKEITRRDSASDKYCWCKMTSPVESQWVFEQTNSGDNTYTCLYSCVSNLKSNDWFRRVMMDPLSWL